MRLSQIRLLALALTVALACCGAAAARERPATTPAARYLQETIETALGLSRPPVTTKASADLAAMIEDSMDWPGLAQFAVGRYRADLDGAAMDAVHARLAQRLDALARRAGSELGTLTLAIQDLRIDAQGNRHLTSTAFLPRFGEVEVEWTLLPVRDGTRSGGYRIADIGAFGLTLKQFLRGWITSLIAERGGDAGTAFGPPQDSSPR